MSILEKIDVLHTNATKKHKEGNLLEAIDFYLEAINTQTEQPSWIYGNAITILGQLNRIKEAFSISFLAKEEHPNCDEIYRAIGIVFKNKGDLENTVNNFYLAFQIKHQQPQWLYTHLLEHFIARNEIEKAFEVAEIGIELYPDSEYINYYFAELRVRQARWKEAADYYHRAYSLNPKLPNIEHKLNLATVNQSKLARIETLVANFPQHDRQSDVGMVEELTSVFLFPDYRKTNSYQSLLYSYLDNDNVSLRSGNIDEALAYVKQRNTGKAIFHLHWTSPILAKAKTDSQAVELKEQFLDSLLNFVYEGGCVIWTIHNILPHDCQFVTEEIDLRNAICQIANKIHIHSQESVSEIEKVIALPRQKIVIVPHGNYIKDNQNYVDRSTARQRFGYQPNDVVYLFLGQIRPYKGIDELITAFVQIQKNFPHAHLLIAGQPVHPISKEAIANRAKIFPNVTVVEKRLSDSELQWFFNAADVVVLPYRKILTSGSVLNALSFSRPVIAPRVGMIKEIIKDGTNGYLYDPANIATLIDAMSDIAKSIAVDKERLFAQSYKSIEHLTWEKAASELLSGVKPYIKSIDIEIETEFVHCKLWRPLKPQNIKGSVAIVILNYREIEDTIRLIESLERSHYDNFKIVVVDNSSPNIEMAELIDNFPQHTIIRTPANLGYAGGNNVGIKYLQQFGFDFVWILNPDTTVEPETLANLARAAAQHQDINIFGSAICYGHRPETVWFAGGLIQIKPTGFHTCHMYDGCQVDLLPQKIYEADYITGASLFCRIRSFTEVGLIPERYFLYFEETEWCLRAKENNYKLAVVPTSKIYHHKRSQTGGLPTKYYFYYYIRGSVLFMLQYFSSNQELVRNSIYEKFIYPWNKKIQQRAPKQAEFFAALAERAVEDGLAGVTGKVDLLRVFEDSATRFQPRSQVLNSELCLSGTEIYGWVYNTTQPLERLKVKIAIDGQIVENLIADNFVDNLTFGDGNYGFKCKLPGYLIDSQTHQIELFVGDCRLDVKLNEFCLSPQASSYKGRIDGIDKMILKGWAVDMNQLHHMVEVEILDGELIVAKAKAHLHREDLVKAGIDTPYGGFYVPIPLKYCDGNKHDLGLRIAGTKETISKRAVMMSTADYPQVMAQSLTELWQWLYQHRQISLAHEANRNLPLLREIEAHQEQLAVRFKTKPQEQLVSIIMPTYNRANTVIPAISSIMAQTYSNWELIIADDGSTDNTRSIVKEFISKAQCDRITLVELAENGGVSKARNAALQKARGEIIAYLDSDNTWDADYLLIMVNMLLENSWAKVAYCGDRILQYYPYNEILQSGLETVTIRLGHFHKSLIENRNYIDLNVFIHRRELYQELGGFREDMRRLVDWELILRYTNVAAPKFVPAILVNYFMGLCDNQITQHESYAENSLKLQQTLNALTESNASQTK